MSKKVNLSDKLYIDNANKTRDEYLRLLRESEEKNK